MANKFKSPDDHVFRVVGELDDGTLEVLHGPYAKRGAARGVATNEFNAQIELHERHGVEPRYIDIYAQETEPKWFRV